MKRWTGIFTTVLALVLMCGMMTVTAYAKDLEPCYHCNSTGRFYCPSCGNTGTVTCDGCGGKGGSVCAGEVGKGPCNHGYYTCPSCHGDTYARSGDGTIPPDTQPGTCGNCGGKGKMECWTCHGSGWNACTRCDGKGKAECQNGNCKESRKVNWKCHYCMGAGYLLTNFWPGENDGVQNVPVKGDKIWVNGKSTTYGGGSSGSSSGGNSQTSSGNGQANAPQPDVEEQNAASDDSAPTESRLSLPENRNTDFDIPALQTAGKTVRAAAAVEMGRMSDDEQRYYAGLEEGELEEILTNVQQIVSTVEPGRFGEGVEDLLQTLAKQNGYESLEEGRLVPIYFEGHQGIGFPVKVTVTLDKGTLNGGSDIYMYHQTPNGEIEALGKAEYTTYEDGSVETISFYTAGFSCFFTAASELNTELDEEEDDMLLITGMADAQRSGGVPAVWIIVAAAVLVVAAGTVTFLLVRKSKKTSE